MKRLTLNQLRNLIKEEARNSRPVRSKRSIAQFIFEQDEETAAAPRGLPSEFKNPQMTAFSGKDNIKDIDATEIVAQLASGNPEAPVFAAIAPFHNPQFTPGIPKADTPEGVEAITAWVLDKGPSFLRDNIANIQGKLPSAGKSKDQMPALEPSDVGHVKDALTPGGELNIDLVEPLADDEEDVEVWHAAQTKKEEVVHEKAVEKPPLSGYYGSTQRYRETRGCRTPQRFHLLLVPRDRQKRRCGPYCRRGAARRLSFPLLGRDCTR